MTPPAMQPSQLHVQAQLRAQLAAKLRFRCIGVILPSIPCHLCHPVPEGSASGHTCRSIWGFQSLSNSTTTSAVYRLMPRPPARVDSRKTNFSLPGRLKSSIWLSRSSPLVLPAHAPPELPT